MSFRNSIFKNSFTYAFSKKTSTCNWLYCFIRLKIMSTCFSIKKWKNTSLDIIKPGNIDKSIFLLISLLFVIGLFFSLVSTSLIASDKLDTNSYFFFFKHLIYVLIGIFLIFMFSSLNSDQLYKYSIFLFLIKKQALITSNLIKQ